MTNPAKIPGSAQNRPQDAPRPRGRPKGSTAPPDRLKSAVIRVCATPEQAAAFDALLGANWLRSQCDRAIRRAIVHRSIQSA